MGNTATGPAGAVRDPRNHRESQPRGESGCRACGSACESGRRGDGEACGRMPAIAAEVAAGAAVSAASPAALGLSASGAAISAPHAATAPAVLAPSQAMTVPRRRRERAVPSLAALTPPGGARLRWRRRGSLRRPPPRRRPRSPSANPRFGSRGKTGDRKDQPTLGRNRASATPPTLDHEQSVQLVGDDLQVTASAVVYFRDISTKSITRYSGATSTPEPSSGRATAARPRAPTPSSPSGLTRAGVIS